MEKEHFDPTPSAVPPTPEAVADHATPTSKDTQLTSNETQPTSEQTQPTNNETPPALSNAQPADAQQVALPPQPPRKGCWLIGLQALWCACKWCFRHWQFSLILIALTTIALLIWRFTVALEKGEPLFSVEHTESIQQTPEELRSIKDIGQWEFLAVESEELVEAHRTAMMGDSHLVRIYRGTLRLGLDLHALPNDWCSLSGKTATLRLPAPSLLDSTFIDENQTTSFFVQGNWDSGTQQRLYDQAAQAMRRRALTPENLMQVQKAAQTQFTNLLNALGYDTVRIDFIKPQAEAQR